MAFLCIMTGIPGSGKSTYAENLAKEKSAVIVSTDAIREELFGTASYQKHGDRVFEIAEARIKDFLEHNKSVIFDAMNLKPAWRRELIEKYGKYVDLKMSVAFEIPAAECVNRQKARERQVPPEIIYKKEKEYVRPTAQEGFDIITIVKPTKQVGERKRHESIYYWRLPWKLY